MTFAQIKRNIETTIQPGHSSPMGRLEMQGDKPVVYRAQHSAQGIVGDKEGYESVDPTPLRQMHRGYAKRIRQLRATDQLRTNESVDRRQEPDAANIGTEKLQRRKLIQKRLEKEFPTTKTGNVGLIHGIVQQRQLLGHLSGDKPLYTFAKQ